MNEDLSQASQDLLNASREVQKALIRVQRLQEEVLPKDLRIESRDYFDAAGLSERSLNANIGIVSHIKMALKQTSPTEPTVPDSPTT